MLSRFGSYGCIYGYLAMLLGLLCFSTRPVWPQATSTSTVTGVVTDQQGAVIPGATIKLTDAGTGATQTATSNAVGRYVFVNVLPGMYSATFSKEGFNLYKVAAQKVNVGTTVTINATLEACLSPAASDAESLPSKNALTSVAGMVYTIQVPEARCSNY
jgi:hypothetical protein